MNIKIIDATKDSKYFTYGKSISNPTNNWFIIFEYPNGYRKVISNPESKLTIGFDSKESAEDYALNYGNSDCIYLVMKNADFTEGRGPMYPDKEFKDETKAYEYIMSKCGIYGSPQYHEISYGCNIADQCYVSQRFNGYEIKEMQIE